LSQDSNEILSEPVRKLLLKKNQKITNVDEDMEKRKHLCTTSENVNYYTYYAKEDEEFKKNKKP
jgi:hypothetical protein